MTTLGAVTLGVYVLGYVLSIRWIFRWVWQELDGGRKLDWGDATANFLMALLGACFWPLWLFCVAVKRTVGQGDPMVFARRIAGESREMKIKRMEREQRDREDYIDRLERELNIGPAHAHSR